VVSSTQLLGCTAHSPDAHLTGRDAGQLSAGQLSAVSAHVLSGHNTLSVGHDGYAPHSCSEPTQLPSAHMIESANGHTKDVPHSEAANLQLPSEHLKGVPTEHNCLVLHLDQSDAQLPSLQVTEPGAHDPDAQLPFL
jgi:hypothetical protein